KEPSSIEDVYEDRLYKVWSTNPGVISWKDAMADGALHDFALSLNMNYSFIDLREPSVGMGFSWGRYGPDTEVRRFDRQRIFAYAAPEKKPGLFSRLFGR
ncbi:MAG TPA: hypothetical protein VG944_00235, partial [Fimbriimonas sp.]|nr:hypothetical protein [Fimbriimonas sp.]